MTSQYDLASLRQEQKQELHRDRVARVYFGEVSDPETQRRTIERIDWMLEQCQRGRILDIGCSEGIFAVKAAQRGHSVHGIDIHPDAVAHARELAAKTLAPSEASRVTFEVSDLFALETIEPEYDAVVLGEVIEHVYEPANMLGRAMLALRQGGVMVVTTPWGYFPAPDHHQTFFLQSFLSIMPDVLEWRHLSIVDGYIRFTAIKAAQPGEAEIVDIQRRNHARFNPGLLLDETESAAFKAQRFLREVHELRYEKWREANEATTRLKLRLDQSSKDHLNVQRQAAVALDEQREIAAIAASKASEKTRQLSLELAQARKERDQFRRERGDVSLALRISARTKIMPLLRRGRAYVEARPALKMWVLRNLPPNILYRLTRLGHMSAAGAAGALAKPAPRKMRLVDKIEMPNNHDIVVLCATYPNESDRYGGEFIRARVEAYQARGKSCLVIVCNSRYSAPRLATVAGVDLLLCPYFLLSEAIGIAIAHPCSSLFVHSPVPEVTAELSKFSPKKNIILWFHGFEVRDYRRLAFNYSTEELELRRPVLDSLNKARFAAVRKLDDHPRIQTVFVSDYIRGVARADCEAKLENALVIPNFIDGDFFAARVKTHDMARRILLIRSFEARNYANDIAIGAIQLLARRPEFGELQITIRGTGRYFRSLTAPLAAYPNVDTAEVYLSPAEIKALHDAHGLFLVPSWHDTQGVTMCEAMASGLVCITNPVAAIPEYFDETCGYFARPESIEAFADAVLGSLNDATFSKKSRRAAERVREQCNAAQTIARELSLLQKPS